MLKRSVNFRSISKIVPTVAIVALYWFWVNKRLVSGSEQALGLTTYFLLMCTATAYFPLPANILVLGAVKTFDPLTVAVVGGIATVIALFCEYLFFSTLLKFKRIQGVRDSWLYRQMKPLFQRKQFLILTLTNFVPIPAEVLRIYAISERYSKWKFALSGLIGRIPRYFLLAYYGKSYVNSLGFLVAVFVFPIVLLLMLRLAVGIWNYTTREPVSERFSLSMALFREESN